MNPLREKTNTANPQKIENQKIENQNLI